MLARPLDERLPQPEEAPRGRRVRVAQIQREVAGYLVVSGPARVEPPRHLAYAIPQPGLDVHVDVFEAGIEGELTRLQLRLYVG